MSAKQDINPPLDAATGDEVRRLTAELATARRELESFTYIVAHDLRAPLRAVIGFSTMVVRDYATQLDEDGQRLLGVVRSEAQRMGRLLDDVLALSRLDRQPMEPEPIDMHALAQEVFDTLSAREPTRKLRLDLEPLPTTIGTHSMLRQVWVNLIANAIKFTNQRAVGEIEVGASPGEDGCTIYHVKDNGVGFDLTHAEKLFGIFQHFHGQDQYPGNGSGLALTKRIVDRHGGRIWAEAAVNHGATFYFTIPHPKP